MTPTIRRGYVYASHGHIHYAEAGAGRPLLLLHQTPRSWDEYRELIPIFASRHRVVAMDLPGMGHSDPLPNGASIEGFADAAIALLDALGIANGDIMGHHTGSYVAMDIAGRYPERVRRVVLSSPAWIDDDVRQEIAASEVEVDNAPAADDGSHLLRLWRYRQGFYPAGRRDLLQRYIRDALAANDPLDGHRACMLYDMTGLDRRIVAPMLLLGHDHDPYSLPLLGQVADRFPAARRVMIEGGMVPLEAQPGQVARATMAFLDDLGL
jgi:pimeloyl-ACP methyl ester carboxylesterase